MRRIHNNGLVGFGARRTVRENPDIANGSRTGIPVVWRFLRLFTIHGLIVLAPALSAAVFPSEIRLTSGSTLRKCEPIRWTSEAVVVRHAGGVDPVRFASIVAAQRSAVEAARPSAAPVQPKAEAPKKERTYTGQVFVATQGGKAIPLGAVKVRAFHAHLLSHFEGLSLTVRLPKPLATTVTDPDGKFSLTIPGTEPFFLFAQSSRYIGGSMYNATYRTEAYDWRIPSSEIKDPEKVLLTNTNLSPRQFNVTIEE